MEEFEIKKGTLMLRKLSTVPNSRKEKKTIIYSEPSLETFYVILLKESVCCSLYTTSCKKEIFFSK